MEYYEILLKHKGSTVTRIAVQLREFCRTGQFGPIALGMTKTHVEQLLGSAQSWGGTLPH